MVTDRPVRFYYFVWIAIALAIAGGVAAKPAYRWYAHRRAVQIVAEVNAKDFPAGNWDSVGRKLNIAMGLSSQAPEVLRLAAHFLSVGGREEALQYFAMLEETGKANRTDRAAYARLALIHNRPDVARVQARQILVETPLDREALLLGIEALVRLGKVQEATQLAEATLRAHPTSDEATLRLGLLQVAEADEQKRAAGKRLLWELAMSGGPFNGPAAERLAAERNLASPEIMVLTKALNSVTNRSLSQDLILYGLRHRLTSTNERSGLASLVVQRLGAEPTIGDRLQVADWLLAHDAPKRVAEVLDEALCRKYSPAAQRWIQARANAGEWDDVRGLIEDQSLAIAPEIRYCYRAMVDFRDGNTNGITSNLKLALDALKGNPSQIYVVADYAERMRQPKIAAAAYEQLLSFPIHAARAANEILRLLLPTDDIANLITTLYRLREFQPDNQEIANAISWYELVTRQKVDENAKLAAERFSISPNRDNYRLTLALAHLRQQNHDSALTLLESRYANQTNVPTRARLIYAAALGASGQRQAAQKMAATLIPTGFKPEELELVRNWRESALP